jgi:hypothetical protein
VRVDGRSLYTAYVRQGVNADVLGELRNRPLVEEPMTEADVEWPATIDRTEVKTDSGYARIRIGDLFTSELRLEG